MLCALSWTAIGLTVDRCRELYVLCIPAGECRDSTRYCEKVQQLELCPLPQFKSRCCHSCQKTWDGGYEMRAVDNLDKSGTWNPLYPILTPATVSDERFWMRIPPCRGMFGWYLERLWSIFIKDAVCGFELESNVLRGVTCLVMRASVLLLPLNSEVRFQQLS